MSAVNKLSSPLIHTTAEQSTLSTEQNTIEFNNIVLSTLNAPQPNWVNRALHKIDHWDYLLESKIPNHPVQKKIDELAQMIKDKFAFIGKFNTWLNDNGHGEWYKQLATFLIKLPFRAVRNILNLVYVAIKSALYATTHPLKAALKLAKCLILLANELTKPKTWTKIGAGMIGAGLGQFTITGNPFALIGTAIGGAILLGSIGGGSLKVALQAEENKKLAAFKNELLSHLKEVPESTITGYFIGLIMGAIQKATSAPKVYNLEKVKEWVQTEYITKHHLPPPTSVQIDPSGNITMIWTGVDLKNFVLNYSSIQPQDLFFVTNPNLTNAQNWAANSTIYKITLENIPGYNTHILYEWCGRDQILEGITKTIAGEYPTL